MVYAQQHIHHLLFHFLCWFFMLSLYSDVKERLLLGIPEKEDLGHQDLGTSRGPYHWGPWGWPWGGKYHWGP